MNVNERRNEGDDSSKWLPPRYPYKSVTIKGLKRMLARKDIQRAPVAALWLEPDVEGEFALYCPTCADLRLQTAQAKHPDEDVVLSGDPDYGWDAPTEDGMRFCSRPECGVLLDVWLTEQGINAELEYLEDPGAVLDNLTDCAALMLLLDSGDQWYAWNEGDPRRDRLLRTCTRLLELEADKGSSPQRSQRTQRKAGTA